MVIFDTIKLPFIRFKNGGGGNTTTTGGFSGGQQKHHQQSSSAPPPLATHSNYRGAGMDFERWVSQQMDLLKMRSMTSDRMLTGVQLPQRLADKIFKIDVNERNGKGETLMISVILYVVDEVKQAKFLNLLLRMGADVNLTDKKHQRTPIMFACLHKKASAVRSLVDCSETNLSARDRLGNTALMYAALQGDQTIIDLVSTRLAKSWSFDIFLNKNRTGKTAESMALWSGKLHTVDILRSNRLRMLQRMHKQLSLIHYSAKLRGWKGYSEAYYAVRLWRSKLRRQRHTVSVPDLIDFVDHATQTDDVDQAATTASGKRTEENDWLRPRVMMFERRRVQSSMN